VTKGRYIGRGACAAIQLLLRSIRDTVK